MAALFPLPLTPFEYYYWCDDQADYPTAFPVELSFSGTLEREALDGALATVVARHPLLGARIACDRPGAPQWIDGDGRPPVVEWCYNDATIGRPPDERIDLTREPGLRAWVHPLGTDTRLVLQVHHCCCDGLAAMRVCEELLLAYHELVARRDPLAVLKSLEPERLKFRAYYGADGPVRPSFRDLCVGASGWLKLLAHAPAALPMPRVHASDESRWPFLGFITRARDSVTVRRLRGIASSRGGTFNDLLLTEMFHALVEWTRLHGGPKNPWLRINMPATLRSRDDALAPASNALGFTFLTRRAKACRRDDELFESIRRETEAIRKYRLGLFFVGGLAMAQQVPGMIPWVLRRPRSFATMVLSNLGKVLHRTPLPRKDGNLVCGNAILKRIAGVPPIRPLTRAAIAVVSYGGETTVNLRCDPKCFSPDHAEEFLDLYMSRLAHDCR